MSDLSELIQFWIRCSNDIYKKWFRDREHGAHDFVEVEAHLLEILVIRRTGLDASKMGRTAFFKHLRARYINNVNGNRQVFKRQAAGNLFGTPQSVAISKGASFSIQTIDTLGTMQESEPYAEVLWQNGFLLESASNLEFYLEVET